MWTNNKAACVEMCPKEEIKLREKERLLHVLEMIAGTERNKAPKADVNKMVKCYSRSAAGKNMNYAKNLRTPEALLKTVNYLLLDVANNKTLPWHVIYEFIADRLLAVRQDMVIQRLRTSISISLLQPIVRFYAYSSYRSCNLPISQFDPVTNVTNLQECLKRLLKLYDECDALETRHTSLNKCINFNQYNELYIDERPCIEAMYLLLNLGDSTAITRGLSLPRKWRKGLVCKALDISLCIKKKNWIRTCRLFLELPSLLACVASIHLPAIRRKAFDIMSIAYNSKCLVFPVHVLKEHLLYSNNSDITNDCIYYKINCEDDIIHFLKSDYDPSIKTLSARHEDWVTKSLFDKTISQLVLNGEL